MNVDASRRESPQLIRLRMMKLPLKQVEIAQRIGVSRRTVIRMMQAHVRIDYPTEVCVNLLCEEFGVWA